MAGCFLDRPEEVVVVTGGSGGIGEALVRALEKRGAAVAIIDLAVPGFELGKNTRFFECNVGSWEAVKQAQEKIIRTILSTPEASLCRTFDFNVLGVPFCIKAFLPSVIARDHGHIAVMSSIKAFMTATRAVDYAASKAAVTSLVEGLQTELVHEHENPRVKVSAIFPAVVSTDMAGAIGEGMDGFMLPTLRPEAVARRVLEVLESGSRYACTLFGGIHCAPG
ncbi:hypothetical protein PWT90_07980 [Aphanocladium album]|nr:hypothetical protein PWT90_07980 [Aphanocladium album]